MRLLGLTLCLLASSFGARAESIEDRMASLERQVKTLEEALRIQSEAPTLSLSNLPTPQLAPSELTPDRKLTTGVPVETKTNNQLTRK